MFKLKSANLEVQLGNCKPCVTSIYLYSQLASWQQPLDNNMPCIRSSLLDIEVLARVDSNAAPTAACVYRYHNCLRLD